MVLLAALGLLAAVSCDPDDSSPDPAEITGRITACEGSVAIGAARIDLKSGNTSTHGLLIKTAYTDGNGYYQVKVGVKDAPAIEEGNTYVYIEVSAQGYHSKTSATFLIELERSKEANLCMDRVGVQSGK
jgi:hypothetical protein